MSDNVGTTASDPPKVHFTLRSHRFWILAGLIAVIAAAAQLVGPAVIPLGAASVTLLPMVWGLLAGLLVSAQRRRPLGVDLQTAAATAMGIAVLVLCGRLAVTIGPNIGLLVKAGPALLLQELGHLFGTIVLALPLAVLLRMGPSTVGATFSIDREASFAMVGDRYGIDSPQYRGVLSMYVFGSIFGAALVGVIASLAASLRVFDPLALAMGAGVGSGSMMAAATGSVVSAHPELKDQVLAVAATSNLITSVLGVYVGMFVALPLAERVYRLLSRGARPVTEPAALAADGPAPLVTVGLTTALPVVFVVGVLTASLAAHGFSWTIVAGYAVMTALLAIGVGTAKLTRGKVAPLFTIITLGALLTSPVSPVAAWVVEVVGSVDFLSIATVVLTIAGLSLGKDLPKLRGIGWRIVPVGIVAVAASYLLSTVVAEFALGLWH